MKTAVAILLSVAMHAFLAACLALFFGGTPSAETSATLDLAHVALSLVERSEASAVASGAVPAARADPFGDSAHPVPAPSEPPDAEPVECRVETRFVAENGMGEVMDPSEPFEPMATSAPASALVDAPPRPKQAIRPEYPRSCRQRGEHGDVTVEAQVDAQGHVLDVRVAASCGIAALEESARRAVLAARFEPARAAGRAVASVVGVTLSFELRGPEMKRRDPLALHR